MQTQDRVWHFGLYTITKTERAIKVDVPGARHDAVALAEITGVDRKVTMVFIAETIIIKHRGGQLKIQNIPPKMAKEIIAAIGF